MVHCKTVNILKVYTAVRAIHHHDKCELTGALCRQRGLDAKTDGLTGR